jgi:hypothetical protein
MVTLKVDRDSVHAGDDMSSHQISIDIDENMNMEELLNLASKKCVLPTIYGGKATWFAYLESEPKIFLGVLAQQWKSPKFLVNSTTTVEEICTKEPAKLIFRYWCQADPELVFKALINNTELPSRYS